MNQNEIPPAICPICGKENACAMEISPRPEAPCWCTSMTFTEELLRLVPAAARDRACICRNCAGKHPPER
ncbi:MAG: cysteine-rich family protein [Chlorobi bacterium]|nr:cysteine-rich family protein [Chlorobiota bacterium]